MDSNAALELASLDAIGQAKLVASGELSAVDLLEAAITRLEAARDLDSDGTLSKPFTVPQLLNVLANVNN